MKHFQPLLNAVDPRFKILEQNNSSAKHCMGLWWLVIQGHVVVTKIVEYTFMYSVYTWMLSHQFLLERVLGENMLGYP